jgi:thymidine kinase
MFAGKTNALIERIGDAQVLNKSTVVFKPITDTRSDDGCATTHDGRTIKTRSIDPDDMSTLREHIGVTDVVGVDEVNFFSDEIVEVVQEMADNGMFVALAGLNQTFRGEPFSPVNDLMAIADKVELRDAFCLHCMSHRATRNQRLIDGEPAPYDSQTILVGGSESYEARCRECHVVPQE